ncbi:MAG TPA: DMT family transporter [Candidatus Kapabacteria bacterium]|nr:DMT family transporter [Candidatus Kapabacteria bacterium]HPO63338.1 DMT family transporter [Candidatus Kapabacteria bacterium]
MQYIGEISALLTAALWSVSPYFFTNVILKVGAINLNIYRLVVAGILLMLTIFILNIDYTITSQQVFLLSLSGFIGLVVGDTFLFAAYREIGPRVTILIMSLNPAIAAILAFFMLDEVISIIGIVGMLITLAGIALVVQERETGDNKLYKITRKGVFYGVMAAVGQGVGLIPAKMAFEFGDINSLVATFVRIAAASVFFIPYFFYNKSAIPILKTSVKDMKIMGMTLLGSIVGPYLGITFSFIAIMYTKIGIASTLMSTMPIMMLPLSHFIYKEKVSIKSIIGALIAVAGVVVLILR